MSWWQRVLIVSGVFYLLWKGITAFCFYWMEQEQKRMPPRSAGLKHEHKRVS